MPLILGVDSFHDSLRDIQVSEQGLIEFFDAQDFILTAFADNPSLVNNPYPYGSEVVDGRHRDFIPSELPNDNPILAAIIKAGLGKFGLSLADSTGWLYEANINNIMEGEKRQQYAEGYALIDMACYIVHLLNIYRPNAPLIHNLISTHTKFDALGRENLSAVEAAIEKVIRKTINIKDFYSFHQPAAIIVIAKHDATQRNLVRSAGRGIDFERECELFLAAGVFEVHTTPATGDFGADLIASKDDLSFAIQCKDTSKPVGVKAVQEAVAARSHYKVDFAVVCASVEFTNAAIELATSNKVLLCNADQLVKRLDSV
jgi:Restriction endonuclease